jgi:hypothetical protein
VQVSRSTRVRASVSAFLLPSLHGIEQFEPIVDISTYPQSDYEETNMQVIFDPHKKAVVNPK